METLHTCCEIVEAKDDKDCQPKMHEEEPQQRHMYSIEDDINRLFQAIDIKTSVGGRNSHKNPMKRPMRVGEPQAPGIGISESMNLKQALRGLSLSQASEMAAIKRRSLRSATASSTVLNVGTPKRLYGAVVSEANDSVEPSNKFGGDIMGISLSENIAPASVEVSRRKSPNQGSRICDASALFPVSTAIKTKTMRPSSPDKVVPLPSEAVGDLPDGNLEHKENSKLQQSKHSMCTIKKILEGDNMFLTKDALKQALQQAKQQNDEVHTKSSKAKKSPISPRLISPAFRNKTFFKRKIKADAMTASTIPKTSGNLLSSSGAPTSFIVESACKDGCKASNSVSPTLSGKSAIIGTCPCSMSKVGSSKVGVLVAESVAKTDGRSKLGEKGEISQSSKSSIGKYSCSTSNSYRSSLSGSSRCGSRPHMSKNLRWEIVLCVQKQHGSLNLRHFKLLKRLGSGDIGTVYLSELVGTNWLFALKVMDNEFLARRKKLLRAQTEREILQMLDHPFLPTLYAHFTTDKLSCLVMEYCPGGDLHVLRQRQPCRCFSEQSTRFYVTEVLLALEYLHMLGVIYRDLKPENVLVREDGHIMLSDFDLSLRCIVNPTVLRSSSLSYDAPRKASSPCIESSCIDPFCIQPSWQVSCFTPRLLTAAAKSRKMKADQAAQDTPWPQLVAEPTEARSNSFVGTHEYLAPEIIKGEGHGSAVDWWTLGIFLYELLYGKTPFKGSTNEETLGNVVSQPLKFPVSPIISFHARHLIRGLLIKEPENRLGFVKGAAEIKQHPFFEGLNWALIRCAQPPERPRSCDILAGSNPDVSENNQVVSKSWAY